MDYRICTRFVRDANNALNTSSPAKMREILGRRYRRLRTGPGRVLHGPEASFSDMVYCPDEQVYAVLQKELGIAEEAVRRYRAKYASADASSPIDDLVAAIQIAGMDSNEQRLEDLMEAAAPVFRKGGETERKRRMRRYGSELVRMMESYLQKKRTDLQPNLF